MFNLTIRFSFLNSLILPVQSAFVLHLRQSNKLSVSGQASTFDPPPTNLTESQQQTVTVATVQPRAAEPRDFWRGSAIVPEYKKKEEMCTSAQ